MNYTKVLLLIFLFTFSHFIFSQTALSVSYDGYYDDNIFNNFENSEDYINSFSLSSAYNFESELNNIQLYYEGNLSSYRKFTLKTSDSHRIGIVETHLFSINDNPLNAGLNFSLRNNREEYMTFDFNQLSAYINYRHLVTEGNALTSGYLFRRNNFKNLPLFSHYEHIGFLRWTSEFNTGTSLNAGAEINYKRYFYTYNEPGFSDKALQLKFSSKIYQVLSDYSGLALQFEYRKSLTDESRYFTDSDYIYYEEEIFNDIYSNEGVSAGVQFTQLIIDEIILGAEARYISKNFISLNAADREGIPRDFLRKDELYMTGALINFDFGFLLEGMGLELRWNYILNKSNDYYYDYNNNLFSFSLSYNY